MTPDDRDRLRFLADRIRGNQPMRNLGVDVVRMIKTARLSTDLSRDEAEALSSDLTVVREFYGDEVR